MSEQTQPPSPAYIFETINAYQRTAALKGAIALELFTAIGAGAETAATLAQRCGAAPRGMRILCDYLVVIGFLSKENDRYRLTRDAAVFLDRSSPAYIGTIVDFLATPDNISSFDDVAAIVRRGGTVRDKGGNVAPENPVWVKFARAMVPMMAKPAEGIAELLATDSGPIRKVLDVAAGHGMFGLAIARRNAQAVIHALDWPAVLDVAKENAAAAGLADRLQTVPGSAFEQDFGTGHDVVLFTNFLHHFDPGECEALLRKAHAALRPGGRVVTLEFVPNEDRVSPPIPAMFAFMMLGTTPLGDAYTFKELEAMHRNAGFDRVTMHAIPASEERVIIGCKP